MRATHKFEKRVVFSFAHTLRGLLVSPDRSWLFKLHKDTEEGIEPGEWTLLMPRADGRLDLGLTTQRLTAAEKDIIMTNFRAENSTGPVGDGTSGEGSSARGRQAPSGAGGVQGRPATAQWLRNLAR